MIACEDLGQDFNPILIIIIITIICNIYLVINIESVFYFRICLKNMISEEKAQIKLLLGELVLLNRYKIRRIQYLMIMLKRTTKQCETIFLELF